MIAFASLFLGLVLGIQTVGVVVSDEVASVEILLNGEKVAVVDRPPWSVECDLGDELAPHELVAVARGLRGEEIARAEQWVNLPRATAEATLILEAGRGGRGRTARLSWDSLAGARRPRARVLFDGEILEIDDPSRFELPDYDPNAIHFLRAELDFGEVASSSAEIVFGGRYGDQVSTQLTAIPVFASGRRKLPRPERLDGWFRVGDREARVTAVEKGIADIVVVRDEGATPDVRHLTGHRIDHTGEIGLDHGYRRGFRSAWEHWRLQQLWPRARRAPGAARLYDLFPVSPYLDVRSGPLAVAIALEDPPEVTLAPQRLADAVVVAGLGAASGKRRRAVILLLGAQPRDASRVGPGNARRYLERLHVPLYVWSTRNPPAAAARSWGSLVDVSSPQKLQAAAFEVERSLRRQRVVWLEGRHLPHRVALTERAVGIELVQ